MNYLVNLINILLLITIIGCGKGKNNQSTATENFQYKNHFYTIIKDKKSYSNAQKSAISRGGYLVEINTEDENNFILKQLQNFMQKSEYNQTNISDKSSSAYIWIGASNNKDNQKWIWDYHKIFMWDKYANGQTIGNAYNNWGKDQPHNQIGELSASFSVNGWENGRRGEWRAINREHKLYYIIEYNKKKNQENRDYGYSFNKPFKIERSEYGAIYYPQEEIKDKKIPFVLFSPGWGSTRDDSYYSILTFIAKQGYAVIYAKDPAEVTTSIIIDRFQKIIDKYNFLDFSKFGVIGHSSGGGNTFNILKHFTKKGWGKDGNFILATASWFAFDMKESDFKEIPSNSKIVMLQFAEDQTTDPRIPLRIYSLLTTIHNDNKDYVMIPNANHGYIAGNRDYTLMQDILYPLDALMDNVFNENPLAKRAALENGNDDPYGSGLQPIKPSNQYDYPCNPPAESTTLFSKILSDGINYCELP